MQHLTFSSTCLRQSHLMGRGYKRTKRTSHFEREVRALLFLLEVVVVDFDAEDDAAAG